jgi:alpha-tubulin suppressor-like RCC1 family protein
VLPKPVEALRGGRVGNVAAGNHRNYAVAHTGELLAWGYDGRFRAPPLGHGELEDCPLPKPIESLRGIKVDAVATGQHHTLALADDGSVYAWGNKYAAGSGALGLGPSVIAAEQAVPIPQRIPTLRMMTAFD